MAEDLTGELNLLPTLSTTLALLNESPPITNCQFEIWYSEWPRLKWLAQGIRVPGLESKTLPVHFSGFQVPVIINTTYEGDMSLQMDILADEYGQYYAHWRNHTIFYSMDPQKGKPILGGKLNEVLGVYQGRRYLVVKLVNSDKSPLQHCWRFHNFKVTGVGEVEMSQSGGDLVTFPVTGIYTHISYTQSRNNEVILGGVASGFDLAAPENPTIPAPAGPDNEQPPAEPPVPPEEAPIVLPDEPEEAPASYPLFPAGAMMHAHKNHIPDPYESLDFLHTDDEKKKRIQDLKDIDKDQKDKLQELLGAPPKDNQYLVGDCIMTMGNDGIEVLNTKTGEKAVAPPNIEPSLDTDMNSALKKAGVDDLFKQEGMMDELEYLRAARIAANGGADVQTVQGLYQGSKLEEAAAAVTPAMTKAATDELASLQDDLGLDATIPEDAESLKSSISGMLAQKGVSEDVAKQAAKQAVEQAVYDATHPADQGSDEQPAASDDQGGSDNQQPATPQVVSEP